MNMFRHHHISHYHEPVTPANFLQSFKEKIAILGSREQRRALITTGGDEMQILRAVVSPQTCRHIRTYLLLITLDVTSDHSHPSKTAKGGAAAIRRSYTFRTFMQMGFFSFTNTDPDSPYA